MSGKPLLLFGGALKANVVGAFVHQGETFHVIRPGYCAQGRRRPAWTQIVHGDIPIYTLKLRADLGPMLQAFRARLDSETGGDTLLLGRALEMCKSAARRRFKDGVSGEQPAPPVRKGARREAPERLA